MLRRYFPCALGGMALVVFFGLAILLMNGSSQQFDESFLIALRNSLGQDDSGSFSWLVVAINDFTHLGSIPVLMLIVLIVCGGLVCAGSGRRAGLFLIYALGGLGANLALKGLFSRPRPEVVDHLSTVYTSSFPSSHAMVSAIIIMGTGMVIARSVRQRNLQVYALGVAALLVFFTGLSRLYLGVHYPSDVLAGWSGGIFWFCVWWFFMPKPAEFSQR